MLASFCLSALAPWGATSLVSQTHSDAAGPAQGRGLQMGGDTGHFRAYRAGLCFQQ